MITIFRSPLANYYKGDIQQSLETHSEEFFKALAADGFNAVWLRGVLRDLCVTSVFPELGEGSAALKDTLNQLCRRAAPHGVKVFLYFNEPLAFPRTDPFWTRHPALKGQPGTSPMDEAANTYALCTSHPEVIAFLEQGTRDLFASCPLLGGVFMITRSEHHTHCYSHNLKVDCPLCRERSLSDVIAGVVNAVARGMRAASPTARTIAWNWSWPLEQEAEIISKLDKTVAVMADFERGGCKVIAGIPRMIDEYSLAYVGPSEKFRNCLETARRHGLDTFAKLQVGTTHELATVNNLPLIPNLLGKVRGVRAQGLKGILGCWNFGNRLTLNTFAFHYFSETADHNLDDETLMRGLARAYFPGLTDGAAADIVAAWRCFSAAFDHHPFCISFLYIGPINYAVRYPLPVPWDTAPETPMCFSWTPLPDRLGTKVRQAVDGWRQDEVFGSWRGGDFTLDEMVLCLERMTVLWSEGLALYDVAAPDKAWPESLSEQSVVNHRLSAAATALSSPLSQRTERELRNARVIHHVLRSCRNIFRAYRIKVSKGTTAAWRAVAQDELAHLQALLPLLHGEQEIGYHSEAQAWFFTEELVQKKIADLEAQLSQAPA
ncbi:MAG: hypothetical protein WCG36_02120 [bacterium]